MEHGPSVQVTLGVHTLRGLLREQSFPLRDVDLASFPCWLGQHLARWQKNPEFVQRVKIREVRRTCPRLRDLEKKYRSAVRADAASPQFSQLERIERELIGADKAVAGLTAAVQVAEGKKRRGLRQKLKTFQARRDSLREQQQALLQASPQRQALQQVRAELQQFRSILGLDREEACLKELLKAQGRRTGRGGVSFEHLARELTQSHIVPSLLRGRTHEQATQRLRVLSRVTLGAARTEFDQLVVRLPRRSSESVQVLAIVEVKRNLNDLAHGFRQRQADLAWLTRDINAYDPQLYRTRHFPTGHFDRATIHTHDDETLVFDDRSFRSFHPDPGSNYFLNRLHFITRPGPMWGVSSAALARIAFRVATDERWDPEDDRYLRGLLCWCQSLAEPIETPDLLEMYCVPPRHARQILMVGT